jgi:hypothetical protein
MDNKSLNIASNYFKNMIKKLGSNVLRRVDDSKAFWIKTDHYNVVDRARSLEELAEKLKKAPTASIVHHMREGKNDFASWVSAVLGDNVLAKKLRSLKAKNWDQMQKMVVETLEERIKEIKK